MGRSKISAILKNDICLPMEFCYSIVKNKGMFIIISKTRDISILDISYFQAVFLQPLPELLQTVSKVFGIIDNSEAIAVKNIDTTLCGVMRNEPLDVSLI